MSKSLVSDQSGVRNMSPFSFYGTLLIRPCCLSVRASITSWNENRTKGNSNFSFIRIMTHPVLAKHNETGKFRGICWCSFGKVRRIWTWLLIPRSKKIPLNWLSKCKVTTSKCGKMKIQTWLSCQKVPYLLSSELIINIVKYSFNECSALLLKHFCVFPFFVSQNSVTMYFYLENP